MSEIFYIGYTLQSPTGASLPAELLEKIRETGLKAHAFRAGLELLDDERTQIVEYGDMVPTGETFTDDDGEEIPVMVWEPRQMQDSKLTRISWEARAVRP